jgi:hypothetical protein
MKKLSRLVGEWRIEAVWSQLKLVGQARFEWIEGGAFFAEHWDFKPAELPPAATWIIGSDESGDIYTVLYHDSRGVSRLLHMSVDDNEWKMWRNDPHFAQRLTGKFSRDGNSMQVSLEKCLDGKTWEHDFDIKYTRSS